MAFAHDTPDFAALIASVLRLMTHHARSGCERAPRLIVQLLNEIGAHADARRFPLLQQSCARLIAEWEVLAVRVSCPHHNRPGKAIAH